MSSRLRGRAASCAPLRSLVGAATLAVALLAGCADDGLPAPHGVRLLHPTLTLAGGAAASGDRVMTGGARLGAVEATTGGLRLRATLSE